MKGTRHRPRHARAQPFASHQIDLVVDRIALGQEPIGKPAARAALDAVQAHMPRGAHRALGSAAPGSRPPELAALTISVSC